MTGHFLYYLPGCEKQALTQADQQSVFPKYGLDHLIGMESACCGAAGPDGAHGLIVRCNVTGDQDAHNTTGRVCYKPDLQTWQKLKSGCYLGWWNDGIPGPQQMRRTVRYAANYPVPMNDGNSWEFTPVSALPQAFRLNADGEMVSASQIKFASFIEASEWLGTWFFNGTNEKYTDILPRIVKMLSLNYHVSMSEVLALGIFDTDNVILAAYAALGCVSLEKKTDSDTSDTAPGVSDSPGESLITSTSTT